MNDFMLQQLLSENQRLKRELELSKEAIKVSEACTTLIEFVTHTEDPFDKSKYTGENEFIKKSGGLCG
jgi:hypothetical protein